MEFNCRSVTNREKCRYAPLHRARCLQLQTGVVLMLLSSAETSPPAETLVTPSTVGLLTVKK